MNTELKILIDDYYKWLRSQTHLIDDNETDWTAISTPYTGIFNDGIEIYCRRHNGNWTLTDGGDSLKLLEEVGVNISRSKKRKRILQRIVNNYGINLNKDELTVEATDKNFIQKKHYLLQALLEVHELEQLAEHTVKSLFKEDVESYLDDQNILYTKDVKFTGFNGLDYHFDFQIPKRKKEYVLKAANSLQKNTISSFVYSWRNVKKLREKNISKEFDAALILNDIEYEPKSDLLEALQVEDVEIYYWSNKERLKEVLE